MKRFQIPPRGGWEQPGMSCWHMGSSCFTPAALIPRASSITDNISLDGAGKSVRDFNGVLESCVLVPAEHKTRPGLWGVNPRPGWAEDANGHVPGQPDGITVGLLDVRRPLPTQTCYVQHMCKTMLNEQLDSSPFPALHLNKTRGLFCIQLPHE